MTTGHLLGTSTRKMVFAEVLRRAGRGYSASLWDVSGFCCTAGYALSVLRFLERAGLVTELEGELQGTFMPLLNPLSRRAVDACYGESDEVGLKDAWNGACRRLGRNKYLIGRGLVELAEAEYGR